MASTRWDQRFFSTTRGQIVSLLRRAGRTVDELAGTLGLTDNAVRSHLSTLERDGLVEQRGARRGKGKPALEYQLTDGADALFPKAHGPVLAQLLDTLADEMGPERMQQLLEATGRRIAAGAPHPGADPRARLEQAAAILNDLGGLVEVEEREDGRTYLQGYSCPLGAAARDRPELCQLAEALVAEIVGRPAQECCDRADRPRCCFQIAAAPV
jgi:predicted ArsR family transcriptional regulator